jgi:hypothetical protein
MRPFVPPKWPYWPARIGAAASKRDLSPPSSLYRFIWYLTGRDQLLLSDLTLVLVPLAMMPLELQRRMINQAIGDADARPLIGLAAIWMGVLLLQGALKYLVNLKHRFQNGLRRLAMRKMQAALRTARITRASLSLRRSSRLLASNQAQSCSTMQRTEPSPDPCGWPAPRMQGWMPSRRQSRRLAALS